MLLEWAVNIQVNNLLVMLISFKYQYIFRHNPKTAGETVTTVLQESAGKDAVVTWSAPYKQPWVRNRLRVGKGRRGLDGHCQLHQLLKWRPDLEDYFKFCVVRNPWDMVTSLYYWWRAQTQGKWRKRAEGKTLEEFIESDGHDLLYDWIDPSIDMFDRLIRFENLEPELREVAEELGLPPLPEFPHTKGNTRPADTRDYRPLFTPAMRDKIALDFAGLLDKVPYDF